MRKGRFSSAARKMRAKKRSFRIEHLEPRVLLAGDTYLVNFQNDEATPVTRYLIDKGDVFANRGGGFSYGWSTDHTDRSIEQSASADQRFDTLISFEAGQKWEFQLANGAYEVTVAVGDPANNTGVHTINVEGVEFIDGVADTDDPLVVTANVTVSDGRLSIDSGAAANLATRINYVHIVGIPSGANNSPADPTITEPQTAGQVVSPFDVHMEAIGFMDTDGNAHKSTDWEIWTTGLNPEMVWQTLGIQGVERLHTHLGDGIYVNSRAGFTNLAGNTDHELRVRFRDDAGSVSDYVSRTFHTGPESSVFPLTIQDIATAPAPDWEDVFGTNIDLPAGNTILSPTDFIIAIDESQPPASNSPGGEGVQNAIDGNIGTKYLNFSEQGSGFIVTPSNGATIVTGFQISTANDAPDRDPASYELYGTNSTITSTNHGTGNGAGETWAQISAGTLSLPNGRNALGPQVTFTNTTSYTSYKMVFPTVKNAPAANSMQIAEIAFTGTLGGPVTVPELRIEDGATGEVLLSMEGAAAAGNLVVNPPALDQHANLRVVIESGTTNLVLSQSSLEFTDNQGFVRTIYLPAISLAPGQRLDLWVSSVGSTYFGTQVQTEPNFSSLAREAPVPGVPYAATQPGYVVELVGEDYRLPVNIAFVPDPGPNPDDPLYYVNELYGSIQVVTRDGTKHEFATGLLDYNPTGPISGSGEQGLTGIAVRRNPENPEIYELYVSMLHGRPDDNTHYHKVERINSAAGGLSIGTRTVLLDMQPETQGQSHQISNVSLGPDGKLYVHNGDGFTTSTAQDMNQFRGKILRLNLDGTAPTDNPFYNAGNGISATDYIYALGLRNPFGGAWRASNGKHYTVENGPSVDRLSELVAGQNYLWSGSDASMMNFAIYNWSPATAPVNITFVQKETFRGSMFPASKQDHAFISESGPTYANGIQNNGKRVTEVVLTEGGVLVSGPTKLVDYIGNGRSSVVALAAGPDGLYFSEMYEESGENGATAVGARLYRIRYLNPNPNDYNIDGQVDDGDYDEWVASFGSNLLLAADGNGNKKVDASDYVTWRKAKALADAAAAAATPPSEQVSAAVVVTPMDAQAIASESAASATSVGEAVAVVSDELQSAATVETADLAFADVFFSPSSAAPNSGRSVAVQSTVSIADNGDSLLLALAVGASNSENGSHVSVNEAIQAMEDGEWANIDQLFAELTEELIRW